MRAPRTTRSTDSTTTTRGRRAAGRLVVAFAVLLGSIAVGPPTAGADVAANTPAAPRLDGVTVSPAAIPPGIPTPMLCTPTEVRATERWWFFGENAAIDFGVTGTTATALAGNQTTQEGSTVVTDTAGNLQFWSNGQTVFDRNGAAMPNGGGLLGNPSATQTVAAFPALGSPGRYFVVTTSTDVGAAANGTLTYSVVDMSLNGGLGDVVAGQKNLALGAAATASEAIVAAPSDDGATFWVLTFTNNSPNVLAYEFDENGPITGTPVVSVMPTNHYNGYSSLAFSPDMTRLVAQSSTWVPGPNGSQAGLVRVLGLDAATGQVHQEFEWAQPLGPTSGGTGYTADFSPSGRYVYLSKVFADGRLYRYDLSGATTGAEVKATEQNLGYTGPSGGQVRRGPDGRMYVANFGYASMSVVNAPDDPAAPAYVPGGFANAAPAKSRFGLPQMVTGCPPEVVTDHGDAPAGYGTTAGDDGARHILVDLDTGANTAPVMLGTAVDAESDGLPSAAADGDDVDGVADEDAVATSITVTTGQNTTVDVTATNNSDTDATLAGWIDLDADGSFDAGERVVVTVPAMSGTSTYPLTFPAPVSASDTFARFRLFAGTVADPLPTGPATGGEVEDYPVEAGALPTLECLNAQPGILFQEQPTDVHEINLITGDSVVAANDIVGALNATGYNPLDDYIYGYSSSNAQFLRVGAGYQIEHMGLPSNWTTFPGMPGRLLAGAPFIGEFDADGNYWVAVGAQDDLMPWAKIDMDPASASYFEVVDAGNAALVGGWNPSWDWGYNVNNGYLYSIGRQAGEYKLLRFNTTTHTWHWAGHIGPMSNPNGGGSVSQFGAAYTDADGFLYSSDNTTGGIWRTDMSTSDTVFFAQGPSSSSNDGARCFLASLPIDTGDAPASYRTWINGNGPRHGIVGYDETTNTAPLMLGATIDDETDGAPTAGADGDDLAGIDDEDGVSGPITLGSSGATVNVDVTNTTGADATLAGWIDLDGDGSFEPAERVVTTVPASGTYTLVFPAGTTTADTYARFRLFDGVVADPLPTGAAAAGEVEDYAVSYVSLTVEKSSSPAEGTTVHPGDTVDYTITISNDGTGPVTDTLTDDLTGVLDDATFVGNQTTTIGTVDYTAPDLVWSGTIPGGQTAVITYSVVVLENDAPGLGDDVLDNVVTGASCPDPAVTDPQSPGYQPGCHHQVPVARIDVAKAVTSGPTPVGAGQYEIEYEITVTNSGAGDTTYDLDDELQLGNDVTVVSTTMANTTPGSITTHPSWDGTTDTTVVTAAAIDGDAGGAPTAHVYTATVVVEVPVGAAPGDLDCALGGGETTTGATNTATVTSGGDAATDDACSPLPSTTIDKQIVSRVPAGDGTYTLTYELSVTRTGTDGTYDLRDVLQYGDAVTVDSVSASNTAPGTVTTNPAFDGESDTLVADDVPILAGATHTYEVIVGSTVDVDTVDFAGSDCDLAAGEDGTGFLNTASLDIDGTTLTDEACEPLAGTTVTKATTSGPTPLGNGNYTVEYTITVSNAGAAADEYDLDDTLLYGAGITVADATVTNTSPGTVTTDPAWDGEASTSIVTGEAIAAGTSIAPSVHVYTVHVEVTVPQGMDPADADCSLDGGESGTGFLNSATVAGDSGPSSDTSCPPVPQTSLDKDLVSQVSNGDGTYTLTYELTVSRTGTDGTYDLSDELMLNEEASVVGAPTVTNTNPGTVTVNPAFDGSTDTLIADDVAITAGEVHQYTMQVVVAIDLVDVTPSNSNCALEAGETGTGAMNQATLDIDGQTLDDVECQPFPATTVEKEITSGPVPLGNGEYELVYEITVTNNGGAADIYDLDDELRYGAGITVVSAQVTNTAPGTITTNPGWDGSADTSIVSDESIAAATVGAPTVHVYTVTVVADAPTTTTDAAADCSLVGGEAGTGFTNTSTLSGGSGTTTADDCAEVPSTDIAKTLAPVVANGDGTYTLTYTIEVERTGNGPTYDLTDTLRYGSAVSVLDVSVTGAPAGVVTNPAFDGESDTLISGPVFIGDGVTHTYTIEVTASIDGDAVSFSNSDCTVDAGESGTGFANTAELTVNGATSDDDACAPLPGEPQVDKTVVAGPTPVGSGNYEITYDIVVTNPSAGSGTYRLDDELDYGTDITIVSADVTNVAPGTIAANPGWDGVSDTVVVGDTAIDGAESNADAVHRYRVTVVATVPVDIDPAHAECAVGPVGGSGFFNTATLVRNGEPVDDTGCADAPSTTIDKTLTSVTPNGDGTFSLVYELTVERTGDGPAYTLFDELHYGDAVTVDSVSASNTTPGTILDNPNFDGVTDTLIVFGVAIGDGDTHVYDVEIVATVDPTSATFADTDCTIGGGETGSGFSNTATLTVNGSSIDDEACAEIPAITVDKTVASGPTPLGSGQFEITYAITVTNDGAGAGSYSLEDELQFGDAITVDSATVSNTAPGTITVDPDWDGTADIEIVVDEPIAAATAGSPVEHVYTVTVIATVPSDLDPSAADCTLAGGENGTGFRNEVVLGGDSGPATATDCAEPSLTELEKDLSAINPLGDGRFELVYDLTVTRLAGGPTTYDLTDDLMLGESLTIDHVDAANDAPGDVVVNPGFDGVTDTLIADDVDIDDGAVHEYTVTVVVDVDIDQVTPQNSDCTIGGAETGTGSLNSAGLVSDGVAQQADDCEPFPSTIIRKDVVAGPTALGNGQYGLTYEISVLNMGAGDDEYDLTDELTYGDGIDVITAGVTNANPGTIVVNPSWDGRTDMLVVADQPIAGASTDPTVHTFRVDVVVSVDATTTFAAGDCALGAGESGTGLTNTATLTSALGEQDASACAEPPLTTLSKEIVETTPNGDGTTTLVYELTVERQGDGPGYDLTDELRYGSAVTIESVQVSDTTPGTLVTNPGFDGQDDTTVVAEQAIADGVVHVYEITVVIEVDPEDVTYSNSGCAGGGAGAASGLLNTATLTTNDVDINDEACEPVAGITIDKRIVDGPDVITNERFELEYEITITNSGAGAGVYSLDDELQYGAGASIVSAEVVNSTPGGLAVNSAWNGQSTTRIATDRVIAAATGSTPTVHRYRVTVVADTGGVAQGSATNCALTGSESGTGFLNTATVTVDGVESDADACAEIPARSMRVIKSSDPAGGTTVALGSTITYTITVTNTGEAALRPATFTDDLTEVLDDADLVGTPSADVGAVTFDGTVIGWQGDLEPGAVARVTYVIRTKSGGDGVLDNVVVSDDPGSNCPTGSGGVDCVVAHVVPPAPTTTTIPTGPLPPTGGDAGETVRLTVILLAAGAAMLLVSRRRRDQGFRGRTD